MDNRLDALVKSFQEQITDPQTGVLIGKKIRRHDFEQPQKLMGLIKSKNLSFRFAPGYYLTDADKAQIQQQAQQIAAAHGIGDLSVTFKDGVRAHVVQGTLKPLKTVKNIIAVASGKGGVGKSTTSANIALALASTGAKVGVLDADIYGPSQPLMFGLSGKPAVQDSKMVPLSNHGIFVNSIGFLIDGDGPAVLRGPMVSQALDQLAQQTAWPDLDYLVVDMPPGTGDIALTLAQKVPVVASVIVTTPQEVALIDAKKGIQMFNKVDVPVLGLVENMGSFVCPCCGQVESLFGEDGGRRLANEMQIPFLGSLPLNKSIREQTDSGTPTVIADPDSEAAKLYRQIAHRIAVDIAGLPLDHSAAFPKVVVAPAQS